MTITDHQPADQQPLDQQPPELRVDPAALRDAARHLRQRPGPLDRTRPDPGVVGDGVTAAAVAAFTASYHAVVAALTADDDAAATYLHDSGEDYRAGDSFPDYT